MNRLIMRILQYGAMAACLTLLVVATPRVATAGCGCTKPPPAPASLRPAAAWSGAEITLFDDALVEGRTYLVRFDAAANGAVHFDRATAIVRRDLADGVEKPQLVMTVPPLPLGPAAVSVYAGNGPPLLAVPDDMFTVAPQPVGIPSGVGRYRFENYRGAVSRAGVVYLSLDFGDILHARVFDATALGLPLRFESEDLAFWNVQGFLMQLLGQNMPGLFAIDASSGGDSDVLHYSRHEFNTYFLQHGERQSHAVDPSDGNWHLDGSPHIDHDHQLLEMAATLPDGSTLPPGPTPAFTLEIATSTLFGHGLVGRDSVAVDNEASVRSNGGGFGLPGNRGDVLSNGLVEVSNQSLIHGRATASAFDIELGSWVTGGLHVLEEPVEFLPVDAPRGLTELGDFRVSESTTLGVGSYHATKLEVVAGAELRIENAEGPVTFYVSGDVRVHNEATVVTADPNPEKFAIYVIGDGSVKFTNESEFHGVVYGPDADVEVDNGGIFAGAFVGGTMRVNNSAQVIYDEALHTNWCSENPLPLEIPADFEVRPGELLEIPGNVVAALTGHQLRIGGQEVPLVALGALSDLDLGVLVPPDLKPGTNVELTLIDSIGCRSWRTVIVAVGQPAACGLLGVELAVVAPLALRIARMRRRRS